VVSGSHRPIEVLAERLGIQKVDDVRAMVRQARVRSFLSKDIQGRAGGRMTDLAKSILMAAQKPTTKQQQKGRLHKGVKRGKR
jgi:hypothetical protein